MKRFSSVFFLACFCAAICSLPASADGGIFGRAQPAGCAACAANGQCAIPPAPAPASDVAVPAAPETCAAPAACAPAVKHAAAEGRRRPLLRLAAGVGKIGKKALKAAAAPVRLLRRR